ncbi:fumarylacetoacetate hydrolase family protein [Ornithinimicrobium faecis]|uniref:fumarylacetoacetate hydrolase family protein n=1 Tax=Ornithinimicrobium faecis TaxID=2934158 RepID=UPI002118DF33|nr:fumarylacetoacetate hydrolase family protein [Ornithinimicrobium sp. HY1745]
MKFASYALEGRTSWGAVRQGVLHDLGPTGVNTAPSLKAAIADGLLNEVPLDGAPTVSLEDVTLLPPIPDPDKIMCIGVNYKSHRDEANRDEVAAPTVFTRFADTQMGHLAPALMPGTTSMFDYEGELALVIGRATQHVSEADAWSHVAGYSVYNDFSVRDWQWATSQWTPGKNFPGTGGFGPYLITAQDLGDVSSLTLETRVNGEVRQSARISDLIYTIPQIIAHLSAFTPLAPGDVIVTGTPAGVGAFMDPPRLLQDGDVVEVEISRLGTLVNTVTTVLSQTAV